MTPNAYQAQKQMEMASQQNTWDTGIAQVSVWDWRIGGEVNKIWHQIINSNPHKAPYFQNSFNSELAINDSQKWVKDYLYMQKRDGFVKDGELAWYEITDSINLEGEIYYLCIKWDRTDVKIAKQVGDDVIEVTSNIEARKQIITNRDFSQWLSELFQLSYFPWGEPRTLFSYDDPPGTPTPTIRSSTGYLNYDATNGYYLEDDQVSYDERLTHGYEFSKSIIPGDYIYIYDSSHGSSGMVWVVTAVNIDATWNNKPMIRIQWVWDIAIKPVPQDNKTWPVSYVIFPEMRQTAYFVTTRWIVQLHWADMITPTGGFYSVNWTLFFSSVTIYNENVFAMEQYGGRLYYGTSWVLKNYVKALNFFELWQACKWLWPFQNYLMLLGEASMSALTYDVNGAVQMYDWIKWTGVRCEWAYNTYLGWFYLIGSDKNLYAFSIIVNYLSKPQGKLDPQSYRVIDQLRTADAERGQKVRLNIDTNGIRIYITQNTFPSGDNQNTKILFFSQYRGFRYNRMINWFNINGQISGRRYWDWVYTNTGDTDDGGEIKQVFIWMFGQDSPTSEKFITTTKALFGQNTFVTRENSAIKATFMHQWRSRSVVASYIDDTEFMARLGSRRGGDLSDPLETLPDGTEILEGNYNITTPQTFELEFDSFAAYSPSPMPVTYTDPFEEQIGKYAVVERGLTQYTDIMVYELIANGLDKLDFGGVIVMYAYTDADNTRLDNVMSVDLH